MIVAGRIPALRSLASDGFAPPLTGGARVDVCIVGAGLAGMIAAYLLARDKRTVMVLDDGPLGGSDAGPGAAPIASCMERPYDEIERLHGALAARLAAQGFAAAIDGLEAIVRRERIACEFERLDGYRFAPSGATWADAEREAEAARRAGIEEAEVVASAPIEGADSGPCVRYPGQAQLHPHKLAQGLARAIAREGGRVHCAVRVRQAQTARPSFVTTTAGHRIDADAIVIPGAAPAGAALDALGEVTARACNVLGLRVPRGSVTRALYWDHADRGRCARLRSQGSGAGEVLLVSGEEPHDALEQWARGHFPQAGDVVHRQSGEAARTGDLFAFTGMHEADSDSVYVSAAHRGSALTRAAMAGMAIRDFIDGARVPGVAAAAWPTLRQAAPREIGRGTEIA